MTYKVATAPVVTQQRQCGFDHANLHSYRPKHFTYLCHDLREPLAVTHNKEHKKAWLYDCRSNLTLIVSNLFDWLYLPSPINSRSARMPGYHCLYKFRVSYYWLIEPARPPRKIGLNWICSFS